MIVGLVVLIGFVIVLVILLVAFSRSMRKRKSPPRRHRPVVLRWLCGVTGAMLVGGLVYGTIRSARSPYQLSASPDPLSVRRTIEPTDDELTSGKVEVLFHYVLGIGDSSDFLPLEIEEVRLPLHQTEKSSTEIAFMQAGNPIQIQLQLHGLSFQPNQRGRRVYLNRTLSQQGPGHYHSGHTGSFDLATRFRVIENGNSTLFHHPYSLFSSGRIQWMIVESAMLLHPDDPGETVSPEDYIEDVTGELKEANRSFFRYTHIRPAPAGFAGLMEWAGPGFLLVFVSAGLWAQCFSRRGTGFTICMTFLIILTVVLDKHNQMLHQQNAEQMEGLSSHRELASRLSENSFFFREKE